MSRPLSSLNLTHDFIARHVKPGDLCIDATAGRGHDTAFLCSLVGQSGRVHAFDIQPEAVESTRALLAQQGSIPLTLEQIRAGLEAVRWPGRMELLSREPMLLLDGAHNPQGARQLAQTVRDFFPNGNAVLVTGMLRTKDAHHAAQALAGCAETILVTAPDSPKVLPPADLAACYRDAGAAVQVMEDYRAALDTALQLGCAQGRPVIVTGSLYLVGAARTYLLSKDGPLASSEAKG